MRKKKEEYSTEKMKSNAMEIKHLHVSDYSKPKMYQTNAYLCGLYYRFHLNKFYLT
jgi:hypothetical protein